MVDPVVGPPDLTGTYSLQSFSSALLTGGNTLVPPAVDGTSTIQQLTTSETEATGTVSISLLLPDGQGGSEEIVDSGTYIVRTDGTWEQSGSLVQGLGTYTVEGGTLTVMVTEPVLAVSTTVWQRQ